MNRELMTAEAATKLLDELVFERVLGFVDLDGLYRFEQELWMALTECGVDEEHVPERAREMIERALRRVPDDPRRYVDVRVGDGMDCVLCEAEAQVVQRAKRH